MIMIITIISSAIDFRSRFSFLNLTFKLLNFHFSVLNSNTAWMVFLSVFPVNPCCRVSLWSQLTPSLLIALWPTTFDPLGRLSNRVIFYRVRASVTTGIQPTTHVSPGWPGSLWSRCVRSRSDQTVSAVDGVVLQLRGNTSNQSVDGYWLLVPWICLRLFKTF